MPLYNVPAGSTALTAAATKSIILLNPVTPMATIRQIDISMDASAVAAGVRFDVYRVVTIGSAAGAATTPAQADERDAAAQSSALTWLTTEPTTVTVLGGWFVQPLGGLFVLPFPYGAEIIAKAAGARIGLRYTTAAGVTPNCVANLWFQE